MGCPECSRLRDLFSAAINKHGEAASALVTIPAVPKGGCSSPSFLGALGKVTALQPTEGGAALWNDDRSVLLEFRHQ